MGDTPKEKAPHGAGPGEGQSAYELRSRQIRIALRLSYASCVLSWTSLALSLWAAGYLF